METLMCNFQLNTSSVCTYPYYQNKDIYKACDRIPLVWLLRIQPVKERQAIANIRFARITKAETRTIARSTFLLGMNICLLLLNPSLM